MINWNYLEFGTLIFLAVVCIAAVVGIIREMGE
jgi:hypothetical protein